MEWNDIKYHKNLLLGILSNKDKSFKVSEKITSLAQLTDDRTAGYMHEQEVDVFDYLICRDYGDLRVLHYNPKCVYENKWDSFDGILRHCRGLVINTAVPEIVLLPYDKFFNIGEKEETSPENIQKRLKNRHEVQFAKKMDGSLICARWYRDKLVVATSGTIGPGYMLTENAEKYILDRPDTYLKMLQDYPDWTFMFEYIFPDDPHIVIYEPDKYGLYLHGMRDVNDGQYKTYSAIAQYADSYGVLHTEFIKDATFDSIKEELHKWKHDENEGYVMNIDGFFVKMKCEDYINYAGQVNGLTNPHKVMSLYISGELDCMIDDCDPNTPLVRSVLAVVEDIKQFESRIKKLATDYYNKIIVSIDPSIRKDFFIQVNKIVPKDIRGFVVQLYNDTLDIWHTRGGHQMTYTEMQAMKKKLDGGEYDI